MGLRVDTLPDTFFFDLIVDERGVPFSFILWLDEQHYFPHLLLLYVNLNSQLHN